MNRPANTQKGGLTGGVGGGDLLSGLTGEGSTAAGGAGSTDLLNGISSLVPRKVEEREPQSSGAAADPLSNLLGM